MVPIELFAVQPYMSIDDYRDANAFYRKIESLFIKAARLRSQSDSVAIIAFPEDIATFLALAGRSSLIGHAETIDEAFRRIGQQMLPGLLWTMARDRTSSLRRAFFTQTANTTWQIWHHTMSDLARRFAMTTIAGSALLPHPLPGQGGDVKRRRPFIYNTSVTYGPDGQVLAATRKVNLVPGHEDVLDLSPGQYTEAVVPVSLPKAPSVRIATAICYDGFLVPHTDHEPRFQSLWPLLDQHGVDIVVVPSANPWPWNEPWPLDRQEPKRLRRQQWSDEALPAALRSASSVVVAMNPHLLAALLDVHFDGQSMIWARQDDSVACLAGAPSSDCSPQAETVVHTLWHA
jgi:predicted amidohydrolase